MKTIAVFYKLVSNQINWVISPISMKIHFMSLASKNNNSFIKTLKRSYQNNSIKNIKNQ